MARRVLGAQYVSRMCMVCGTENRHGLGARFFELEDGDLAAVFTPRSEHQGYPGRLHGGLASALLDETIGRAINVTDHEAWGVTVELSVRYRKPVPLDAPVTAVARLKGQPTRLFEGTGEIVLPDDTVAVEARGKYMRLPIERIAEGDFEHADWQPDERPLPKTIDIR